MTQTKTETKTLSYSENLELVKTGWIHSRRVKILFGILAALFLLGSLFCFSLAVWGKEETFNKIRIILGIKKEEKEKELPSRPVGEFERKSIIEIEKERKKKLDKAIKKVKKPLKKIMLKPQPKPVKKPKSKIVPTLPPPVTLKGVYIVIDLSEQRLRLYDGSKLLGNFLISSGSWRTPTPTGRFRILNKASYIYSLRFPRFRAKLPYWLQFTWQGHGIHELPILLGTGRREGAHVLGRPVSFGCVRLGVGPAKFVYDRVGIGTPVIIHY